MAQTGYTPIVLYASGTATNTPIAGNLASGELAINYADGKLFYKDSSGVVQVLATKDATSGSFTNLAYTGTLTGGTGVVNLGSGQFYKDASGNVGIGTSSPSVSLDVSKTQAVIRATSTTGTNTSYLAANNTGGFIYLGRENSTGATFGFGAYSSVIVSTGAYPLVTSVNGAEAMRIDSSGNVGIGTSSPANRLEVNSNARITGSTIAGANFYLNNTQGTSFKSQITWLASGSAKYSIGLDPAGNGTNNFYFYDEVAGSQRMTIDSGGNVLVGVTTASYSSANRGVVNIGGSSGGLLSLISGTNKSYFLQTGADLTLENDTTTGNIVFGTNASTERMRIDSDGNLLVGGTTLTATPTSGHVFGLAATSAYHAIGHATGTPSGNYYATFNYASGLIGSITQSGTTAVLFNVTSDQRLKENIQDAESASTLIDALQVRQFDWKTDNTHQRYGFIAQELVTVAPEAVHQPVNKAEMMAVDYSKLVPMLVKEIQSLRKRVAQLESK